MSSVSSTFYRRCDECGKDDFATLKGFKSHQRGHQEVVCPNCTASVKLLGYGVHLRWCLQNNPPADPDFSGLMDEAVSFLDLAPSLERKLNDQSIRQVSTIVCRPLKWFESKGFTQEEIQQLQTSLHLVNLNLRTEDEMTQALAASIGRFRSPPSQRRPRKTAQAAPAVRRRVAKREPQDAEIDTVLRAVTQPLREAISKIQQQERTIAQQRSDLNVALNQLEGKRRRLERTLKQIDPDATSQASKKKTAAVPGANSHVISGERLEYAKDWVQHQSEGAEFTLDDLVNHTGWSRYSANAAIVQLRNEEVIRLTGTSKSGKHFYRKLTEVVSNGSDHPGHS